MASYWSINTTSSSNIVFSQEISHPSTNQAHTCSASACSPALRRIFMPEVAAEEVDAIWYSELEEGREGGGAEGEGEPAHSEAMLP